MRLPVIFIAVLTAANLIASIVSARRAAGIDLIFEAERAGEAANLAAASNMWLTLFGVGLFALLTVWAVSRSR